MKNDRRARAKIQKRAVSSVDVKVADFGSNRNFELLLMQIVCRRLNPGRGIVRARVGLSYDPLRLSPCSGDLLLDFSSNTIEQ